MAKPPKTLEMLSSVPLFDGLSKRELQAVFRLGDIVEHPAGEAIVREGAAGAGFHLVLEGTAKVRMGGRTRKTLGPGDYFGEMALIDKGRRSATVLAETAVTTLVISSWNFNPLIERFPSIARKLLIELSRRVRALEKSLTH